jgi:hypothetical protein
MKTILRFSSLAIAASMLGSGAFFLACSDSKNGTDGGDTDSGGGTDGNMQGDTAGQDGGDGGGGMDAGLQMNCASYCKFAMSTCTGANAQYLDEQTCVKMCANIPTGDAGDQMGNTLGCRVYHLGVAGTSSGNADIHCPHAGPYGFGTCGSNCEDFCLLYGAQCNSSTYGGGGCSVQCPLTATDAGTSFLNAGGNTLACREYHLENAYKFGDTNGMGHCSHAGNSGGGVCQ